MTPEPKDPLLQRIKAHAKRRCPSCQSDKWSWEEAVPISLEELSCFLLVKYRCTKCGELFLVEEAKRSRIVQSAERCAQCQSRDVERLSHSSADVDLRRCRKCNAYMVVEQNAL